MVLIKGKRRKHAINHTALSFVFLHLLSLNSFTTSHFTSEITVVVDNRLEILVIWQKLRFRRYTAGARLLCLDLETK